MRSELPWVKFGQVFYPIGVIADRQAVGNNAYSVETDWVTRPRVARFALQPWATRNYFGVDHVACSRDAFLQPATCNLQPATCNLQPATCNLQPATCNLQRSDVRRSDVQTCHLRPLIDYLLLTRALRQTLLAADVALQLDQVVDTHPAVLIDVRGG